MFTGLVEETGEYLALERSDAGARLAVRAPVVSSDVRLGDSIAVNGCCLTVTEQDGENLTFRFARRNPGPDESRATSPPPRP